MVVGVEKVTSFDQGVLQQPRSFCSGCFEKQRKIDHLQEEIERLKGKLRQSPNQNRAGLPLGPHTPPSQQPFRSGHSSEENRAKKGGRELGHPGAQRRSTHWTEEQHADETIQVTLPKNCPDCGEALEMSESKNQWVLDVVQKRVKKVLYRVAKGCCPCCRKTYEAPIENVFSRSFYSNSFLAHILVLHYCYGVSVSKIQQMLGPVEVSHSGLIESFHRMAKLFEPSMPLLIQEYRQSAVKHADETTWSIDGKRNYAWMFASIFIALFHFPGTRSSQVVREILGDEPLPGVLVVDRYAAYNRAPCQIQYCYAHLLRDLEALGIEFPQDQEVKLFVDRLASYLSQAMRLRSSAINDQEYLVQAKKLQEGILWICNEPAHHLGIQSFQSIFLDHADRLYHWTKDRSIPAENNFAERMIRKLIGMRDVALGSQSQEGAHTRGILMSLLLTAYLRLGDFNQVELWLKESLDVLCKEKRSIYSLLPPIPRSPPRWGLLGAERVLFEPHFGKNPSVH